MPVEIRIFRKLLVVIRSLAGLSVFLIGTFSMFVITVYAIALIDPRFTRTELDYSDFINCVDSGQFETLSMPDGAIMRDRLGRRMLVLGWLRYFNRISGYECRYVLLPDSYTDQRHKEVLEIVSSHSPRPHSDHGFIDATHVAIALPCFALLFIAACRNPIQRSVCHVRRASFALSGVFLCFILFAAGLFFGSI